MTAQSGPRQDPLNDQLHDVAQMAADAGCHDAADWIKRQVKQRSLITPEMRQVAIDEMRSHR